MDKHLSEMIEQRGMEPSPITPQMFGNAGREHMEKYGMFIFHTGMQSILYLGAVQCRAVRGVMTWSMVGALSELCSPFSKEATPHSLHQ